MAIFLQLDLSDIPAVRKPVKEFLSYTQFHPAQIIRCLAPLQKCTRTVAVGSVERKKKVNGAPEKGKCERNAQHRNCFHL